MAEGDGPVKAEAVDAALNGMKLEEELMPDVEDGTQSTGPPTPGSTNNVKYSSSPRVKTPNSQGNLDSTAPTPKTEDEGAQGVSDITIQVEPGKTPKLSRKATSKMAKKPAPLFDDLPDATVESKTHFTAIRECIYGSKYMGASEHDTLGCDCSPEYKNGANNACGEDSDCINRATKMECTDDECNCGAWCQNQRFQRRQYAKVSVIKTEKKGFGLRADTDLQPQDFIFEYIGEVINEAVFRRRTHQYHDEGIKHFYFMSLTKNVFVDATKKGNLGRFCNHSCNPNCYVDKWVVGDKLRMGIFAERPIKAGEELVFNYNVDRYGADPQPCYCGENNCTGFIGGKTQTERATKLSNVVIEALGIEDGDGWDIAVAKKPRKKKQGEDDEEYVNNVQPKGLDENGVTKVMATLMQCKEKWVAVKLLSRVQRCNDDKVRNRVVRMHGYQILGSTLKNFKDDNNVVLQILDILYKLPRLTRNKIVDSKIETAISTLIDAEHDDIAKESKRLLDEWGKLDLGYRIPRKKFDPNASEPAQNAFERTRRTSDSKPEVPEKPIVAPSGPRSNVPQRNNSFYRAPHRPKSNLPTGWFATVDQSGRTYYYSKAGQTTWQRPNEPAADPPPPPVATAKANQKALQSIIDSITKIEPASKSASPAPKDSEARSKKEKKAKEDWRSWPVDKQMRQYENTISKHVIPIMNRFSGKLPKDVLKKFAKDIGKKLVASDFKNNTVTDVRGIPEKKARKIKGHVTEFFKKAVVKQAAHDAEKAEKARARATKGGTDTGDASTPLPNYQTNAFSARTEEVDVEISDDEGASGNIISINGTPFTPAIGTPDEEGLKRKRSDLELDDLVPLDMPLKRLKESPTESLSPPPPPPPPPGGDLPSMTAEEEEEEVLMRESEEALMKENEEAMVEDEFMRNKEFAGRSLEDTVNGGNNYSNGSRSHSTSMGKRIGSGSANKNIQLERDSNSPQTPESSSCMDESFDLLHPDRRRQLQDQRKRAMGL